MVSVLLQLKCEYCGWISHNNACVSISIKEKPTGNRRNDNLNLSRKVGILVPLSHIVCFLWLLPFSILTSKYACFFFSAIVFFCWFGYCYYFLFFFFSLILFLVFLGFAVSRMWKTWRDLVNPWTWDSIKPKSLHRGGFDVISLRRITPCGVFIQRWMVGYNGTLLST